MQPAREGPILVYGPRSLTYDFGPYHPLTPRRFGPGIDLLRAVGAEPDFAPEPAPDDQLLLAHTAKYITAVRRLSADPFGHAEAGIGPGDDPPFAGMHDAAAAVAGGSIAALEAILRGGAQHAYHPGGGLHHAMPDRASGFCIYNDPGLAIAWARLAGKRVLYIDLDVHHGDGVQAIHSADPGVLTVSFHESGRYLFPGTGFPHELGDGVAAGTSVNVPFEPPAGERVWLAAVESIVPPLAAAFGPDLIVSQHGADSHAWDPLAHLRVTTTAIGAAARLVDRLAHTYAGGAWLATGGGGYDVYRVVPRAWALTWLAGAHRDPPEETPRSWRERWAVQAARHGQAPMPVRFDDEPNAGLPVDPAQELAERQTAEIVELVRQVTIPTLLRVAGERGWWSPGDPVEATAGGPARIRSEQPSVEPTILAAVTPQTLDRLRLAARVIPPADPTQAMALLRAAAREGAQIAVGVTGDLIVGAVILDTDPEDPRRARLLALGVAPGVRKTGMAGRLLERLVSSRTDTSAVTARFTVADRDPFDPLPIATRRGIALRLLERSGFVVGPAEPWLAAFDPNAFEAIRVG